MVVTKQDCEYDCLFHKGKIEWHHPISERWDIGMFLCEAHHSLIQGRKHRYPGEMAIDKTLSEMTQELVLKENALLLRYGLLPSAKNKH